VRATAHLAGSADGAFLDAVHDCLDRLWAAAPEVPLRDRIRFDTALAEVVANVVRHAVPAGEQAVHVDVSLMVDAGAAQADVVDDGAAVPVDLDRGLPPETATSGRGLVLIQRAVDKFGFERRDGRNIWRIVCRYRV
jgi:serine/threonine-protein kinase RsbW